MSKWKVGKGTCVVSEVKIKTLQGGDEIEYYGGYLVCESVHPDNALLIAAAPELLDALEELIDIIENGDKLDSFTLQPAKCIVIKAKGEVPV